jgi:rare lipoprotein A
MRMLGLASLIVALLAGCTTPAPPTPAPVQASCAQEGMASWYQATGKSAAGERLQPQELVAAHRTLPLGTLVRVTSLDSGRSVVVRIGDRGPFAKGRIIDLSRAAAEQLGMRGEGVAHVRLEIDAEAGRACPLTAA